MVQPSQQKAGYVRGLGRTFVPSAKAEWVEEFNRILGDEPGWSRNRLTEYLIEKGLAAGQAVETSSDDTHIQIAVPRNGLTEEQQAFLESEQGKTIAANAVRMLLAGPDLGVLPDKQAVNPLSSHKETASSFEEEASPPPPSRLEKTAIAEEAGDKVAAAPVEQAAAPAQTESPARPKKLSPLAQARNKLKRQNLT
ncbi:hypothetical protein [Bacillus piscicola]|uniref:hypothetical protein n=1 Tax=Bacillus piscicola TaxID=1632684 RepID=UPI001F09055E|nr:hypothetical protein [Bacillus piscicola]